MSTDISGQQIAEMVTRTIRDHWVMLLVEGIALVILGLVAIALPPLATLAATIVFGWILLASGVLGLIATFITRNAPGFWWSLISGVLGVAAGVVLLAAPVSGAVTLTLVLAVFFALEGAASIMCALDHRQQDSGRWAWMLVSGIIDLVLAAIIVAGLPGTAAWAIGLLVGINMLVGGTALIAMALHARPRQVDAVPSA